MGEKNGSTAYKKNQCQLEKRKKNNKKTHSEFTCYTKISQQQKIQKQNRTLAKNTK